MIDVATVALLTAGVKLANEVVSVYGRSREVSEHTRISTPGRPAGKDRSLTVERTRHTHETLIVNNRAVNRDDMDRIIREAVSSLDELISHSSGRIVDELRSARVKDAIQDVKARAVSLNLLLTEEELDPSVVIQILVGSLNPLQVSLEKARYVMEDYGDKESWQHCYLVGAAALLAGYKYIGQQPGYLERDLREHTVLVHCSILDKIAAMCIESARPIPWQDVPTLIRPEGADALRELFASVESAVAAIEQAPSHSTGPQLPFDVSVVDEREITTRLEMVTDVGALRRMVEIETAGRGRRSIHGALYKRISDLEAGLDWSLAGRGAGDMRR